jgi:hypothetical protein
VHLVGDTTIIRQKKLRRRKRKHGGDRRGKLARNKLHICSKISKCEMENYGMECNKYFLLRE